MNKILLLTRADHEPKINYIYHWADEVIEFADDNNIAKKVFSGKDANRRNFEDFVLSMKPRLLILNGHGGETVVGGQNDAPILDMNNVHVLKGSIVYAVSCRCAKILGAEAVRDDTRSSFIGYSEKFRWVIDPAREATPLKDRCAEPFRQFSNTICISLLEGKSAKEACDKARQHGNKLIRNYGTTDTEDVNQAIRFLLFWDMELLTLHGNPDATFN